jgi:rhamnosyltransferase subunit B
MRVLLATLGSGGDVHPYVAIARELIARGHAVWFLTNPYFEERVRGALRGVGGAGGGLAGFVPLGTREEYLEALSNPELVHPTRGPEYVMGALVLERAREMFVAARKVIRAEKIDVVGRHLIAFGAGWAARREGVREVSCALTPLFWLSTHDSAVYRHWEPGGYPRWLARARVGLAKFIGRRKFDGLINTARAEAGLGPIRDAFVREVIEGERTLGLWSKVFRGPVADDPAHGSICGFTWFDGSGGERGVASGLEPGLEAFVRDGEAPIVFTLGTSVVHHAGAYFAVAERICADLKRRGVLLVGPGGKGGAAGAERLGVRGGGRVYAAEYAAFSALLHRGCCTVHHGGIGTTAQALRAGRVSVVTPYANDEFDNAARVQRLGAGLRLNATRASERRLRGAIERALGDARMAARAAELGERLRGEDGAGAAAGWIEGRG